MKIVDLGPAEAIDQLVKAARVELQAGPQNIRKEGEPDAEKKLKVV